MSKIYISKDAYSETIQYLTAKGHEVIILEPSNIVYPQISCHPDIFMCSLNCNGLVFRGDPSKLGYSYPDNIIYNAASTGKYFIHRLDKTDMDLLAKAKSLGLTLVNVKQGYSKCNICIVDENHIITSDEGIHRACKNANIHVLLIDPGYVLLPGFNYGFIGGCSGLVGNQLIFNGDLSSHPDFDLIKNLAEKCGKELIYFKGKPLVDIGSIIEERRQGRE